jgi:glycosyltransferase involved in cell wall biosynthesis
MKITVIVPVRNGERCLALALESLRSQTYSDFELLVVDNASTDRSGEIAQQYATRVIREDEPGLANARNAGIAAATGDVLAFTDADCRADDRWVEHVVRFFEGHPAESVVTGETCIPEAGLLGDAISALGFPGGGHVGFARMWRVDERGYTTKFTGCNFAIRKEVFEKVGLFHPRLKSANDDSEMAYRLVQSGCRVRFLPYLVIYHEPRCDLRTFARWHFSRGRSNYHFKSLVDDVGPFVRLRLWSTMNILTAYWPDFKIILIVPLLALSFLLQQAGFLYERAKFDES